MFRRNKEEPPEKPVAGSEKKANYFLKISLLGDGAVGKTNIRRSYLGVGFTQDHLMTIGADFAATERNYNFGGKDFNITFQIWDLAGQSTFSNVRSMYYRGCFGGFMVFDRTRPSSFQNIPHWLKELEKNSGKGMVPIVLLGNKYDLIDSADEVVSMDDINTFVDDLNKKSEKNGFVVKYLDTSALTGLNIDKAFETLGETILRWQKAV